VIEYAADEYMRYRKNEKKDDVLAFRALGAILTILNLKKTLYTYNTYKTCYFFAIEKNSEMATKCDV
jgi:hypothetical protein